MKTPYFLIDEDLIERNCRILNRVRSETGCKVLLAQKAFSCYDFYPLIARYLDGTTASGLFEAKLGKRYFKTSGSKGSAGGRDKDLNAGKHETHVFAPAFTDSDMREIVKFADHIVFNSKAQLLKHHEICRRNGLSVGIRVNPEIKTQSSDIYDPCARYSRFGMTVRDFETAADEILPKIDGLHFHTLCEQALEPLKLTLAGFEQKFGKYIENLKWVNFGGGHHITRQDYDVQGLVSLIKDFRARYGVGVYLEPGEAVVFDCGTLTSSVLDIVHNEIDIAVLDTSAAAHNPDILETQHEYTPEVIGAKQINGGVINKNKDNNPTQSRNAEFQYRLAGNTCLAGDIIGDYVFRRPLVSGDTVTFTNTALYTVVKTNMFNGINLPALYMKRRDGRTQLLREFGFADYITRLGK